MYNITIHVILYISWFFSNLVFFNICQINIYYTTLYYIISQDILFNILLIPNIVFELVDINNLDGIIYKLYIFIILFFTFFDFWFIYLCDSIELILEQGYSLGYFFNFLSTEMVNFYFTDIKYINFYIMIYEFMELSLVSTLIYMYLMHIYILIIIKLFRNFFTKINFKKQKLYIYYGDYIAFCNNNLDLLKKFILFFAFKHRILYQIFRFFYFKYMFFNL